MSRAALTLNSKARREQAARWCMSAPAGTRIEFKAAKRTLPQNALLWLWLTAFADQAEWAGKKRTTLEWKDLLTAAVKIAGGGVEAVPGLEGGLMLLGLHTSDMSVAEMNELLAYIEVKAADLGVTLDLEDCEGSEGAGSGESRPRAA